MTILFNIIKGLRHGEGVPAKPRRISNHARRRCNVDTCPAPSPIRAFSGSSAEAFGVRTKELL